MYIPAERLEISWDVAELFQEYWYGFNPPETETSILPLVAALQFVFIWVKLTMGEVGSVKVMLIVLLHKLASVIVRV